MKRLGLILFWSAVVSLMGQDAEPEPEAEPKTAEEGSALPQWKEDDWESVRSGELIPGSTIFGEIALERLLSGKMDPIEMDPAVREIPEEKPEPEQWPTEIGGDFLSRYFHHAPETFLMDPQDLLTDSEKKDQAEFLQFHAADCQFDLYLYLFDSRQEIPVGESLQSVVLDHFGDKKTAAVVFYFMGDPKSAELSFSEDISDAISRGDRRDLLKLSIEEALEREEPLAQLEDFSNRLSQRLKWLEKELEERGALHQAGEDDSSTASKESEGNMVLAFWLDFKATPGVFYPVTILVGFALSMGIFIFLRYLIDRRRVFIFPDAQGNPLLGAPHAPGVGSIISYSNRTQPPSLQRNNYPDYLQRM